MRIKKLGPGLSTGYFWGTEHPAELFHETHEAREVKLKTRRASNTEKVLIKVFTRF